MSDIKKSWYAIYVKSRAEKKVALELEYNNIDYYLPLIKRLKQWSDRRGRIWLLKPMGPALAVATRMGMRRYFNIKLKSRREAAFPN